MICQKDLSECKTPGMCSPHGGCRPEKGFEAAHLDLGKFVDWVWALKTERDRLKAENEALRKALTTIREESHDIGACECAADALADSRKVQP